MYILERLAVFYTNRCRIPLGDKKYRAVNFVPAKPGDIACNHCAFVLGQCRGAIWALGQCYEVEGPDNHVVKNMYFEEVKDEDDDEKDKP